MPPAVIAAAPPAAAKLDLKNDLRSRSSVSLNLRWCNSNSGQFLSSPAHIVSLLVLNVHFRSTTDPISVHRNSKSCAPCRFGGRQNALLLHQEVKKKKPLPYCLGVAS